MTKKQTLAILAPYSWPAAVFPALTATIYYLYEGGSFTFDIFLAIILGAILAQCFTNIVNCYSDYKSGLDNRDTIFNTEGSIIVADGVSTDEVKKLGIYIFFFSLLPIIYLTYIRGPVILLLGCIGILAGVIYSTGPLPLSTTPFGEIYSGIIDGFFISAGVYYVYSGVFSWKILIISLPCMLWIISMTFTNSVCDMEKDRKHRLTLALFLGKERSINTLKILYIGIFATLLGGIGMGLLPKSLLITLLTLPHIWKRLKGITPDNTHMKNKYPIMGLSCGSGIIFFKLYFLIMVGEVLWKVIG